MNPTRLTIIVPAYNEERTISDIVARLRETCPFAQLILVDDGSHDQTLRMLREKAGPGDIVLTKPNEGKGSAVRMGYAHATGVYTIVQDADLEYNPEEIPAVLEMAERQELPAVFGSRRIHDERKYAHIKYYLGGRLLTGIFNLLYGTHLTDQPNCYKMVLTCVIKTLPLRENSFAFDAELAAMLARRKIPIAEFPTSYNPRTVEEGKKIGWKDWFRAVWVFVRVKIKRN
ncbi:glycosyltransferase family 2 protein [Candidatus Peregrinibacteria bacterium]|nr:glycosyltransferase family 2 protein [Candidatus Peregrinibacteria bacterium]